MRPLQRHHNQPSIITRLAVFGLDGGAVRMVWLLGGIAFALCLLANPVRATDKHVVSVLVSRNIKPYMEALNGLSGELAATGDKLNVRVLTNYNAKARDGLKTELMGDESDLVIAIGPEATRFIWSEMKHWHISKMYALVLDPEILVEDVPNLCGISLKIPMEHQINVIRWAFPDSKRVGLIYDPEYNDNFFRSTSRITATSPIRIYPLRVHSTKDMVKVLSTHIQQVDLLWLIPDRTVISESVVKYIIHQALKKQVPVVGFNRFFFNTGAALAFVFDYEELGRQTGQMAKELLSGTPCRYVAPHFRALINSRVYHRLGRPLPKHIKPPLEVLP